jgi:hypothetical protein
MNVKAATRWRAGGLLGRLILAVFALSLSPARAQESICARVRIEILQELTLERQAFEARMTINNGLPDAALTELSVSVSFADRNGRSVRASSNPNDTTALFFIRPQTGAELPSSVAAGTTARAQWLIIPAPGAAGPNPQGELYFVGATLSYTAGGQTQEVVVSPDSILVKPMPRLELDYFLPSQVYGDDPFTQNFVEPVVPFHLGVRVRNGGFGAARKLKIESAQPKIIENELGLLIDFRIDGSEVNGRAATPSLLCDFGDIAPNRAGVARWIMSSSLSGQFVEFTAYYTHADELGGELTSLISGQPRTHFLVWDVLVDLPGRDGVRDFLARDGDVLRVYESDNVDSVVADQSEGAVVTASTRTVVIDPAPAGGFLYVKKSDPFGGFKRPRGIVRADGKVLPAANAWFSSTWDRDARRWTYFLNLFDANNPQGLAYTLEVENVPGVPNRPPKLDPMSNWTLRAGDRLTFPVTASDPDGDLLRFRFEGAVPEGATLDEASGAFAWRPTAAQAPSTNEFRVMVLDAATPPLTDTGTFRIVVTGPGENNTAPTLTPSVGEEPLAYTENDAPRILDEGIRVTDVDSTDFGGGSLVLDWVEAGLAEDRLGIRNEGGGPTNITTTVGPPAKVRYGGVEIGSFSGGAAPATPLQVAFNANATLAAVERLVRNLTYENVSERPSGAVRVVRLTVADGDGGTSAPVDRAIEVTSVNDLPVAGTDEAGTVVDQPVSIVVLKLLANDHDADATSLAVDFPEGRSQQGGTVEASGGQVTYRPPVAFAGNDVFAYRLRDGDGGEARGQVTVAVRTSSGGRLNIESITAGTDGSARLVIVGIPGRTYGVEVSGDLVFWIGIGTRVAGAQGRFEFTDPMAGVGGQRYYRIVEVP